MTDLSSRVDAWKLSLLDPAHPMLDVGRGAVPIAGDPIRLAFVLGAGGGLELDQPCELRAADAPLWLGLGLLAWSRGRVAPIVLWPVTFAGDGRIVHAEGHAPRLNPVLVHALRVEHDTELAVPGELDLAAILRAAGEIADANPDWRVERAARLVACSLERFDLARDLGGLDLTAPPVAYITGAMPAPGLPAAAPGEVIAPLDADASQLAAVVAAGAGASFVLHGAPGTGKSQTIANLVAHCASQGKTVLVVSDLTSALDSVLARLQPLGLAEFCLPIYGEHGASSRALASLGRAVDRAFRPGSGPSGELARLSQLRGELDAHRLAMHAPSLLGISVYDVFARLVELRTTPCAALAEHDAPALDHGRFLQRLVAVEAFADAARAVEPVAAHPWRAAAFESWNLGGVARARTALEDARAAADELAAAVADVSALVPGLLAHTPDQLRALGALAERAAASPRPGAELLTSTRAAHDDVGEKVALLRARGGGSIETPREPGELLAIAARQRTLSAELDETFTDAVAAVDANALWTQLKRWTQSMAPLRYVALRAVRAEVRAAALQGKAETDEAMLVALECAIAERACRTALDAAAEPARRWFGELGKGAPLALDLDAIDAAVGWGAELRRMFDKVSVAGGEDGRRAAWRALVAQVAVAPDSVPDLRPFARLAAAVTRFDPAMAELAAATGLLPDLLGAGRDHLAALRPQLEGLLASVEALADWARFDLARRAARVAGVGPAITAVERGDLAADDLASAWERATLLAWLDAEVRAVPVLARFSGALHHERAAAFGDVDRGALALARTRAVARLADRVPRATRLPGADENSELAALRRARGETRPRELRTVLAELPTLLGKIAPCVLATPHALACHLDPALPAFDVVVFDEASRLPVAHALGALARARAAVIIGDSQQCAPASGEPGLLAAALAAGLPALSLAAHYRSFHEDLFAFANRRYYNERVEQRPAPGANGSGIAWRRVDGAVDATGANRIEAEAIATELAARRAEPQRTVAVAVMSRAQQALLEQLVPAGVATIATPDRLQGLEFDDVLVSIGGTPDALGALALPGADTWLAVATTRARQTLTVFASFEPDAIAADAPAPARSLAELLAFARAGGGAARPADVAAATTPICAAIARALGERGWTVHHGVGCGPYKVALAVVDPADPARYVLAIEDDGPAYASAPSVRDRDRLRVQELARLGWRVHRIWALDWWRDAERELARAHGAIVAAVAASRARTQPAVTAAPAPRAVRRTARGSQPVAAAAGPEATRGRPAPVTASRIPLPLPAPADTVPVAVASGSGPTDVPAPLDTLDATTPVRIPRGAIAIGPYVAAAIPAGRRAPDDMFAPRHLAELGKVVEQVLAAEAPIHVDLLARRVGAYFGIGRVNDRHLQQVRGVIAGRGRYGEENGVVWRLDQDPASVPGVRTAGGSATGRRDIAEVPLVELAAAARIVVERGHDVAHADLVRDCARLLGFARITDKVTERVGLGVRFAAARQLIAVDAGRARMPD